MIKICPYIALLLLTACANTGHITSRTPTSASLTITKELQIIQAAQIEQLDLRYEMETFVSKIILSSNGKQQTRLPKHKDPEYKILQADLASATENINYAKEDLGQLLLEVDPSLASKNSSLLFNTSNPYQKVEYLNIDTDLVNFAKHHNNEYDYIMDSLGHDKYALALSSELYPRDSKNRIDVKVTCNTDFSLSTSRKISNLSRENTRTLFDSGTSGPKYYLAFPASSGADTSCQIQVFNTANEKILKLNLKTNKDYLSKDLNTEKEACLLPQLTNAEDTKKLLFDTNFIALTCPEPVKNFEILSDPLDGLNKKVLALLGYEIPKDILEKQDPFIVLDFSKAPKLDAIYLSYLVFRHDFYGTLLLRILEHHAQNGTEIKIFNSHVIELEKDHVALKAFALKYPNVKYQAFKYPGRFSRGISDKLNSLHRTNHIKTFITLSESHPEFNTLIMGGRNIHDGFIFKTSIDHSKYPEMVNYKAGDESFVHWMDLEVEIKSPKMARDVARQMLSVWNSDYDSARFQSTSIQIPFTATQKPAGFLPSLKLFENNTVIRHIYSGPYRDGHALEKFYIEMFNSAKTSIQIVSPYLRLSEKLAAALDAALDRGVKITINTRIDLTGDTVDAILTDVNKASINKLKDKVQIYEWTAPGVILHSKLVLIDDHVSFVGGVNLNKRSFIHDFENGVIVYSEKVNAHFKEIIEQYDKGSRLVTEEQNTKWWTGIIIKLLDDKF